MIWIYPIILLIVFEAVADVFAKQWSLKQHWYLAVLALLSYVICNTFWLFALKNGSGLARGGMIFSVACAVLAIVLGLIVYKEPVSKTQILGIVIGVVSIVLIFWQG